jgi:hypothetical protein
MKRPKKKTGGNGDAAHRWNSELLTDQASPVNTPRTHATKSEKIKATLKAKVEKFRSQTIKVDENWSIVRADELNWQIRHKHQRAPYDKWFFGTLRGALLALPDKMLGEEAKNAIADVSRCYRSFCEAVLNALPEGSANESACCRPRLASGESVN